MMRAYYKINVNENKNTAQVRKQAQRIVKSAKRSMLLAKTKGLAKDVERYRSYIDIAYKGIEKAIDINAKKGRAKRALALSTG